MTETIALKRELADAHSRIKEMIAEIDRRDELISDLERRISDLERRIAELEAAIEDGDT